MRARTALRVVALLSTLAGTAAFPPPAAAATAKKTSSKKSSKKSSTAKSSKGKTTTTSRSSTAKSTPAKSSSTSATKAAYDALAPSTSIPAAPATASAGGAPPQRGPTRIDFDDRLIQGQSNKSGAVYLYDRKELKQRSMIKKRETFREEIVGAVYDSEL